MTIQPEPEPSQGDTVSAFRADFAATLRRCNLSLRQAQERSGWAKSTISRAINNDALPKLDLVVDVLTAAGATKAELTTWQERHAALATRGLVDAAQAPPLPPDRAQAMPPDRHRWRSPVVIAAASAFIATLATVLVYELNAAAPITSEAKDKPLDHPLIIEVQNKLALGPDKLIEDSSPAFLSSEAKPFCASVGCRMENTDMVSGAKLVAICHLHSHEMFNYNLDSSESVDNPHTVASTIWYGVELPDGRVGYISEVYIAPTYRGGLGLPLCTDSPPGAR